MKNNSAKQKAHKLLLQNRLYALTDVHDLQRIIESNQFTILAYKKHTNSAYISELIKKLGVENEIQCNDSFLYLKNNLKFLFIHADVSKEDACALLRHELGHISDPDFKNSEISYSKIKKEEFANEFSCYIKNPSVPFKIYVFLIKKWKWLVSAIALLACILGLSFLMHSLRISPAKPATSDAPVSVISDHTYYITSAGKKYHQKHCIIIKYKNNLTEITLDDAMSDGYKPCLICNPNEE